MDMRPLLAGFAITLTTLSCNPWTSTARGINVLLEAAPSVALTDDTVTFTVSVSATSVSDVVINYADGSGDQHHAGGAATARVTFKHVYEKSGSFLARATVSDAAVGNRVVTQWVVVNPRPDSVSARTRTGFGSN
jgi:hypothetical protein